MLKAVIMAGGEGSRLRPLTCDIPKPMARLCGRPIIEYILDLLVHHQFMQAAVTLHYLPDRIVEHFPLGKYRNMALTFVEEDRPLGTAGSVRNACSPEDEDILVISGDALCDFDLTKAMALHRSSGADVTILGKQVSDPREYGLIVDDESGHVTAFVEKPSFSQAVTDLANTGIYILSKTALDMIPTGESYDFANDLFPKMLEKGMKLICARQEGYWCDIGDLETYVRCQQDLLSGRVDAPIQAAEVKKGVFVDGTLPQGDYTIVPPVYIGKNVQISDGVIFESGSVVDTGSYIGAGARISGSILLSHSFVGRRARLTGALVCAGGNVKEGAMLFEGCAIGAGALIGERATVGNGVKVWNQKVIPASVLLTEHVKTGNAQRSFFDDDGITGQVGVELTPEFCARLGAAVGSIYPKGRIAVAHGPHRSAAVLAAAIAAGIQSTGAGVMHFGENFQTQFEFSVGFSGVEAGIFVSGDQHAYLRVVDGGGLPTTRGLERKIEAVLARGEYVRCGWNDMGDQVEMTGMLALYKSHLIRCAPKGLSGMSVKIRSRSIAIQEVMEETLRRLGCDHKGELVLEFSSQGAKVRAYDPVMGYIPHHKILTLCAAGQMELGNDVAVPFDAPRVLDHIAAVTGRQVQRYYTCSADQSDAEARHLAKRQMWSRDGLMQAVMFLHLVRRAGGVRQLLAQLPDYERSTRTLNIGENPAGIMHSLDHTQSGKVGEGVLLRRSEGVVLVRPLKRGTGVRIFAEAHSSETAAELCDFVETLLVKKQS